MENNNMFEDQKEVKTDIEPIINVKKKYANKKSTKGFLLTMCLLTGIVSGCGSSLLTIFVMNDKNNNDIIYRTVVQTDTDGEAIENLSTVDVVESVKESIVEITTSTTEMHPFMGQYVTEGAGSGVIFSKEGLIVTNNHVIDGSDEIKVLLANGEEYIAELVATDTQTDLAVIRIKADNLQPAVLGSSDSLKVGEDIYAVGNPLGSLGGTVTEGILSAKDREIVIDGQSMTLLQISAAINPGNSGGGLFNSKGELVGIVNAKSSGSGIEGLGFAIPIDVAKDVVEDLVENGKVNGRLSLGIKYYEISSINAAMQYNTNTLGLLIDEVSRGSNAEKAGLKSGDIIVEVDNQQVSTGAELSSALTKHKAGETMTFMVVRDREYVDLECVLSNNE